MFTFLAIFLLMTFNSVNSCKDKNNTVQSLLDQFNRHWSSNNLDGLANMYDENVVFINQVEPKQIFYGRAQLRPMLKTMLELVPDLKEHYETVKSTEDCELLYKIGYFTVDKAEEGAHYSCVMVFRRTPGGEYTIIRDDMKYP